jgi:hypothetical protein
MNFWLPSGRLAETELNRKRLIVELWPDRVREAAGRSCENSLSDYDHAIF